jgi:hypothetical protein
MCIDNKTNPDPQAITALQNAEIAATVRAIFAHENWIRLQRANPGMCDLELLKRIALQAGFIELLRGRSIVFREEEFAR